MPSAGRSRPGLPSGTVRGKFDGSMLSGLEFSRYCRLWRRMKEAVFVDVSLADRNCLILEARYGALLFVKSLQRGQLSLDENKIFVE